MDRLVVHAAWVRANTLCLARAEVGCGLVLIAPDIHFILRGTGSRIRISQRPHQQADSALDYAGDQGWFEDAEVADSASWVSLTAVARVRLELRPRLTPQPHAMVA